MQIFLAYIKFLFRSTNQHGVHSPFVYNLVIKCFYDREKYPAYSHLKQFRRSLLKDRRTIEVKDFGAGSRVFKSDKREVSKMAKNAGLSPKRSRLLNRLVRYLEVGTALELGTSLGLGTAAMAAGNNIEITTIEGCPKTAKIAEEKFREFGFYNIELKVGEFEKFLVEKENQKFQILNSKTSVGADVESGTKTTAKFQIPNSNREPGTTNNKQQTFFDGADLKSVTRENSNSTATDHRQQTTANQPSTNDNRQQTTPNSELLTHNFDLLYIDGNHQKEATLSYFVRLLPALNNDSVMIFDDIHWSKGMEEAWEEIKQHPQVKVTIDTFQWGLVFFRREQEKEHFVIRM